MRAEGVLQDSGLGKAMAEFLSPVNPTMLHLLQILTENASTSPLCLVHVQNPEM